MPRKTPTYSAHEVDYKRPKVLARINRKPVGAVVSAASILRYLASAGTPMRVTHIAAALGIHQSTCFNILNTLVQEGLLHFTPRIKGYSIGPQIIALARGAIDPQGAIEAVQPQMRKAAQKHNMVVTIWKRSSIDKMTIIACVESDASIRLHLTVGHSIPMLLGSVGRVMAMRSESSADELREQFRKVRWHRKISFDDYMREANEARVRGYAVDMAVANPELVSIAVPIARAEEFIDLVCCGSLYSKTADARKLDAIAAELLDISKTIVGISSVSS